MSRYRPEKYESEGGFSVVGVLMLLGSLCAAGVGLGWLASFIGQWFYLIVLFPLAIGFGLIMVGVFVGHVAKMRSPGMAVVLGLVASVVAMLSMHFFNYQRFLKDRQELPNVAPLLDNLPAGKLDAKEVEALRLLKQAQTVHSFPSYLDFEATQGVTISRRGQDGFNLGYVGTWIYWSLELVGVAIMAALGMVAGAAAPFCAACNEWKEERHLGTLERKDADVAGFLSNGEIERLREQNPALQGGDLILTAAVCPKCKSDSPIAVKLEERTKNEKGEEEKKELIHVVYPGEALAEFETLFTNKS